MMSSDSKISPRSIVVVDDEIELCTLFKTFLINCGYDAVSFSNPVIALEYLKKLLIIILLLLLI